ncbi:MAG: flagellar basal body L-ring protein FlgH [Burkholderiales bacterium]
MKLSSVLITLAVLGGCSLITPKTSVHQPMTARPVKALEEPLGNGAIYQSDSSRPMLFDDRRARFVGDTLTVLIEEKTSASKNSSSSANKTGSTALDIPVISKVPLTNLQGAAMEGSSATKFEGKGDAATNNLFSGNLTVTVIEVLANGNMIVSGEKQVTINHGTEFIRFSGIVNPLHINSGNAVSSTKVADARIEYMGTGYIDESQNMGWLARFFMNVWPF